MNCAIGDLAIMVRRDPLNPQYVGCLFDVIGPDSRGMNGWWLIQLSGRKPFMLHGKMRIECNCPDNALRPIRPDAEPESTTTTRELAEQ